MTTKIGVSSETVPSQTGHLRNSSSRSFLVYGLLSTSAPWEEIGVPITPCDGSVQNRFPQSPSQKTKTSGRDSHLFHVWKGVSKPQVQTIQLHMLRNPRILVAKTAKHKIQILNPTSQLLLLCCSSTHLHTGCSSTQLVWVSNLHGF